jgi:predicted HTH transcriptional regulator
MFELHDPVALLRSLCGLPAEQGWAEFKMNQFDADNVGKYISGLANASMLDRKKHAYMIWGVQDKTHEILGTSVRVATEKIGNDDFMFWVNQNMRPKLNIHHVAFEVDEKHVEMLVIEPGYARPVSFKGREYIRSGTSLTPLEQHEEKERALWQITTSYSFENSTIAGHMTAEDIFSQFDVEEMLKLLKVEDRSRGNMLDILMSKGLIIDNLQGRYEVTALLGICCAKNLNKYPLLANKGPRVLTYKGADKLNNEDDTEGRRGYMVGFRHLLAHIMGKLRKEEQMQHGFRVTVFKIPEEVVREFLANSLIHQDFTSGGSRPLVEIYKDRVRFINPGTPLIEIDRFIDGGTKSRNPNFARLMREARLCEERGSGVDRAIKEIERAILPPPLFATVEGSTSVTAYMQKRFADMTAEERVRACFQHAQVLHEANESMNNQSLRHRFGLPDKAISQVSIVIREAREAGKIKPLNEDQADRLARYVPAYV